ncbi:hypothetical protein KC131_21030 [Pseudomonas sp. JQ170]|uniref:hypothetical protein n=1 Tax=unclassified Pseudomonas TaxID=196821 RepID=UPI00264DAC50|nr:MULTISPECIES: hypothetical protein [unclassified Pseudomonas]MDN7143135.1 hypothetical protein [Pseudomonas sp. JQ170]WRO74383.1 hypothetical protein U9R80_17900 [Pseudomonas sp. 170C]
MDTEPTNQEVAVEVGIEVAEVERYRRETIQLGDGSWLVHFSFEMPRELRHCFTGSFTAVTSNHAAIEDVRRKG